MSARTIFCRSCGAAGSKKYGKDRQRRQRYGCPHCGKIFTRRTRTLKSGSQLSDEQWQTALKLFCTRAGMSAEDMARLMGINRKTAQKLNKTFRVLVKEREPIWLPGASEWDEAKLSKQWCLGGISRNLQQCLIRPIPDRTEGTLVPLVKRYSDSDAPIFTDEWGAYITLPNRWSVCHSKEFVRSGASFVHTNMQKASVGI